jgi:basic membrane protein A
MKRVGLALAVTAVLSLLVGVDERAGAGRKLRVGFIASSGERASTRTIGGLQLLGFAKAVRELGVEGRVLYVAPNRDSTAVLKTLARQKYDLVLSGGARTDALDAVALEFPEVSFFMADAPYAVLPHRPKNVEGTRFRAEEAGYLAGYLAALMEKQRPGDDVVGSIGGVKFIGVDRWIVGYQAGAKKAVPEIATLNSYSNDFANPAKCRRAALSQIARGAGVVFQVAGACGLGALQAAKERGVWGIGVDGDQSYLGPHILTSGLLRPDTAVYSAVEKLVRGTFTTGGDMVFDLRNGGVGLGKISRKVPRAVLRQLETIRRRMVAGSIKVPKAPT